MFFSCFDFVQVEPDKCRVVSLGTFSKIFAPSMRSGWIYTHNTELLNRLEVYGEHQSGGGFSAFSLRVGEQMIRTGRQVSLISSFQSLSFLHFLCLLVGALEIDSLQIGIQMQENV